MQDADLERLIAELYDQPPVTDMTDEEIQAEVEAVRERRIRDDAGSRSIGLDGLLDEDMERRFDLFIERLAHKPADDDLSDEEINEIVREVRRERNGSRLSGRTTD